MRDYFYYCCYEIAVWYADKNPRIRLNPWYKLLIKECAPGWIAIKLKLTMADVDRQTAEIADEWKVSSDPVFTEKPSQVEGLTEMRLRAPWVDPE
jgi:hypothetical protein